MAFIVFMGWGLAFVAFLAFIAFMAFIAFDVCFAFIAFEEAEMRLAETRVAATEPKGLSLAIKGEMTNVRSGRATQM